MGEESVEDQDDKAPEARPPGEPSTGSDPQEDAPLKVARDPGDPTTKEREHRNATQGTHPSVLGVQFASKQKEGNRHTEMEQEKRGGVRPQFHSIPKLLAKRTIVIARQQPLCTKTITLK